jgi:hypothetical protein
MRSTASFLNVRPEASESSPETEYVYQQRRSLWLAVARHLAGGSEGAPTDGIHPPNRFLFGRTPTWAGPARTQFRLAQDGQLQGCDYAFQATANFMLAPAAFKEPGAWPSSCGYSDTSTRSAWKWNRVQPNGRTGPDECAVLERSIICLYGTCGWRRPWMEDEHLPGRFGNDLTQLSVAVVAAVQLNVTLYIKLDSKPVKPGEEYRAGFGTPFAYLYPLTSAAEPMSHLLGLGIGEWYGAFSWDCGRELYARPRALLDSVRGFSNSSLYYVTKGCNCECIEPIWDWMFLVVPLSTIDERAFGALDNSAAAVRNSFPDHDIVVIHQRRGDKQGDDFFKFNQTSPEFLQESVSLIRSRLRGKPFVVVSISDTRKDAIAALCSANISVPVLFHSGDTYSDYQLAINSDHAILSTGTFSQFISYHVPGIRVYMFQQGYKIQPHMNSIIHPYVDVLDTD